MAKTSATRPGGGALAGSYTANGSTSTWLPLIDTDGSTIGLVNAANVDAGRATTYTYDPSGTPTASGTPNNWPFLYKGMEKEFTDPTPYYYTGGGQFYSPQMVRSLSEAGQTSGSGIGGGSGGAGGGGGFSPSGMAIPSSPSGSSGGLSPQSLGNDAQQALQVGYDIYNGDNYLQQLGYGLHYGDYSLAIPLALIGGTIDFLVNFFEDIFGGSSSPETPRQLQHGRHPLYSVYLGLPLGLTPGPGPSGTPQFCEVAGPAPCPNAHPLQQDNGNLFGKFTRQDGVCTVPIFGNSMNHNPCMLACCKIHDNGYTDNKCNYSSWLNPSLAPVGSGRLKSCDEVNGEMLNCIQGCPGWPF